MTWRFFHTKRRTCEPGIAAARREGRIRVCWRKPGEMQRRHASRRWRTCEPSMNAMRNTNTVRASSSGCLPCRLSGVRKNQYCHVLQCMPILAGREGHTAWGNSLGKPLAAGPRTAERGAPSVCLKRCHANRGPLSRADRARWCMAAASFGLKFVTCGARSSRR